MLGPALPRSGGGGIFSTVLHSSFPCRTPTAVSPGLYTKYGLIIWIYKAEMEHLFCLSADDIFWWIH